nr:rRNA-processing protein UTP23 homolog isoform X1 [Tanacetum cinerariifolium]
MLSDEIYDLFVVYWNKINPKEALFEIFESKLGLLATSKNNPEEALAEIYEKKLRLYTTDCIMQELKREPKYKMLDESVFTILGCKNKVHDHDACIEDVIGSKNEGKFYFATKADHDLYSKMRKKPAVPVIVDMGERLVLRKCSNRQIQLAIAFNDKIPVEGSSLQEINENVDGNVCYESLLLKGQHIVTSFESSDLSEKMAMMEGVPFIVAKDRQLSLMPPSEVKGMPENSEDKRISRKEKAQKRNAEKNEVGRPFGKNSKLVNGFLRLVTFEIGSIWAEIGKNSEDKRISRKEKAQKRNAEKNEVGRPFGKKSKYQTE